MIAALVKTFNPARDIVVFERCGGYERELEAALAAAGVPWAVVHSAWVKAFRQVQGIKAKTDAIDARLLQGFGRDRLNAGRLRLGRTEDVVLDALMARQRQLKAALHAERCRRETAAIAPARASIERMITQLATELAAIAAELSAHESTDPLLAFKEAVMCERKGVAVATARAAGRIARDRKARPPGNRFARWAGVARPQERTHGNPARPRPRPRGREDDPVQSSTHRHAM
jgi:transposase